MYAFLALGQGHLLLDLKQANASKSRPGKLMQAKVLFHVLQLIYRMFRISIKLSVCFWRTTCSNSDVSSLWV